MRERTIIRAIRDAFDVSRGRAKYATIRERIISAARIDGIHLCQLIAAILIASIGLNINSTEAIIGAMLICPLMGSVLAAALAVSTMDMYLFRRATGGMILQCGICLITSTLYFAFSPLSGQTSELLTNSSATVWDMSIALVGGFAGALGLSRRVEPTTLVSGVAVATALMPPICATGYGLASGDGLMALAAFYEFLINVFFIAFGACVVLVWLHMPIVGDLDGDGRETEAERAEAERESHGVRHRLILALLVFAIPCLYFSLQTIRQAMPQTAGTVYELVDSYDIETVTAELEAICPGFESCRVGVESSMESGGDAEEQKTVVTVVTSRELRASRKHEVEALVRVHLTDLDEVVFEVESTESSK